jgi:hypothetical protein
MGHMKRGCIKRRNPLTTKNRKEKRKGPLSIVYQNFTSAELSAYLADLCVKKGFLDSLKIFVSPKTASINMHLLQILWYYTP